LITADLLADLKTVFSENQITENEEQSHLLGNSGKVTIYPKSEDEIVSLLKFANKNGQTITIAGGETKRGFGGVYESTDILLSLKNYKGIVDHSVGDMTITVKSGTPFKELQDYLSTYNQKLTLDPAWPGSATIGGIIAANDSGPKRLHYGSARDVVIGLKTVYPDGTVIRSGGKVVKNVAGYDMNKLLIGSMGTLGVISEITLKLRPLPVFESLALLSFPQKNFDEIKAFAVRLLDSKMEPVTLELLNPSLAERLTGYNGYTLSIVFEDVEGSVRYQQKYLEGIKPESASLSFLERNEANTFWNEFYEIGPNGAITPSSHTTQVVLKIGVVNLDSIQIVKECEQLQDLNIKVEAHGGLGHGLCHVYLEGADKDVEEAITQIRAIAGQLNGYAIGKHLPLSFRQKINVWGEKPSYFFLLESIKSTIDPKRILNPKRFVGGI
jgi:glycolate oxidase FAD binding subunit